MRKFSFFTKLFVNLFCEKENCVNFAENAKFNQKNAKFFSLSLFFQKKGFPWKPYLLTTLHMGGFCSAQKSQRYPLNLSTDAFKGNFHILSFP